MEFFTRDMTGKLSASPETDRSGFGGSVNLARRSCTLENVCNPCVSRG